MLTSLLPCQEERYARFEREDKEHRERRKASAAIRKAKSKSYRKVTRRGQPVMKHRVGALLERIERGRDSDK